MWSCEVHLDGEFVESVLKEIDAYDNTDFSFFKTSFDPYFNL